MQFLHATVPPRHQHNGRKRQRRFGLRSRTFSIEILWVFSRKPIVGGTTKLVFVRTFTYSFLWMAGYNPYPCEFLHASLGTKLRYLGRDFPDQVLFQHDLTGRNVHRHVGVVHKSWYPSKGNCQFWGCTIYGQTHVLIAAPHICRRKTAAGYAG